MANREVVLSTIGKMKNSGIEPQVIAETLKDIGLSDKDVSAYLSEAGLKMPAAAANVPEEHEKIAERTAEKIKGQLMEEREEREMREASAHAAISGLEAKMPDGPHMERKLAQLDSKIDKIESDLQELRSLLESKSHKKFRKKH